MHMTNEQHYRLSGLVGKYAEQLEQATFAAAAIRVALREIHADGIATASIRRLSLPLSNVLDNANVELGSLQYITNFLSGFVCVNCDLVLTDSISNEHGLCARCYDAVAPMIEDMPDSQDAIDRLADLAR